jgi:hypothetical protein
MAINYNTSPIVADSLSVHLDAPNTRSYPGSGSSWLDLSSNGNHGTLTNSPTYSTFGSGSFLFNVASLQMITGVNNATTDLTGDMTAEAWFYLTAPATDWVRIIGKGDSTNRTYGLWYNTGSTSVPTFLYQRYGTNPFGVQQNPTAVNLNTWYHVVGTTSGSLHSIYVNNQLIQQATVTGPWYSSSVGYTLGYSGVIHTYHTGYIACGRIYSRALTTAEVSQNYNAGRARFGI